MERRLPTIMFYAARSEAFTPADLRTRALGGSETALAQLARELRRLGHRVVVVAYPREGDGVYDGVEYVHVRSSGWRRRADIDVTVVMREMHHVLRKLPGRVRLLWAHDHIGIYDEMPAGLHRQALARAVSFGHRLVRPRLRGVVAVSRWLGDSFVRFGRWPERSVWVMPNGLDPAPYAALDRGIAGAGDANGAFRVAYTSIPERGLSLLVERIMPAIWRSVPNVELHVFSYRPLDEYRDLPGAHDRRIHFRGALAKEELGRTLAGFDLWLYPTDSPETSCIAAMEAQAAGLPVVSSRRYALRETIEDGRSGLLIDGGVGTPAYVDRFAAAAAGLLRDPARRAALAREGRSRMLREFTWDRIARGWSELIQAVGQRSG